MISNEFHKTGYGDVAWKFTEVDGEDPDAEDTTVSIHPDLFKACLDENACRRIPRHPRNLSVRRTSGNGRTISMNNAVSSAA